MIVPEQTAYSGVSPGAAMSTPWSGDHVPGGEAEPFGSGNAKPLLLDTGPDPGAEEPLVPDEDGALPCAACAAWAAAAACAACAWDSWFCRLDTWAFALASCPALASRTCATASCCCTSDVRVCASALRCCNT